MRNLIDLVDILLEKQAPMMPLATLIAKNGGLKLDGDARANDFDKIYVPGAGPLARKTGKDIDGFWRDFLTDYGFLEPDADGYMQRDVRQEVFDLLNAEQRKRKFGEPMKREEHTGEQDEFNELMASTRSAILAHGGIRIDDSVLHAATMMLWNRETQDPIDAYERATMAQPDEEPLQHDHDDPFDNHPVKKSTPPSDDPPF
ncbi:MAG: hypothetical protein EOO77_25965 [Oxalobacteraceae bacterium]|nr:MAG: hypothetical protein EOO77_25965 [Oxalobacteraceae bacterium]